VLIAALSRPAALVGGYLWPEYADLLPYILMFVVIALRPEGLVAVERSRL